MAKHNLELESRRNPNAKEPAMLHVPVCRCGWKGKETVSFEWAQRQWITHINAPPAEAEGAQEGER